MLVKEQDEKAVRKGGRLASLAIEDWISGHLNDGFQEWRCSDLRDPSRQVWDAPGSPHDLIIIPTQSYEVPDLNGGSFRQISSMCRHCRYHIVFKITTGDCGTGQDAKPMHHFICKSAHYFANIGDENREEPPLKYNPIEGTAEFACSCCRAEVQIEISVPRLKTEWLNMLSDEDRVRKALEQAKVEEPERFSNQAADNNMIKMAVFNLNKYLKNVLTDDGMGAPKRISFRNKTFMVQFGPPCHPLFRYLEFQEDYDQTRDENFWIPPRLTPSRDGKTELGSPRAFYEDARSELQSLLEENSPTDKPVVQPLQSARDQLEGALQCTNFFIGPSKPVPESELADSRTLGVSGNTNDHLLQYAYKQQCQVDPENQELYVDALARLAGSRGMDLQILVFQERDRLSKPTDDNSAMQAGSTKYPVAKAYAHFGLTRSCSEDPSYFIGVYKAFREQSPAQKHQHRHYLLLIGKDRNSDLVIAEAYKAPMELSEAYNLLEAGSNWNLESIGYQAQSLLEEGLDLELAIMALEAISVDKPDESADRTVFESILAEIRSRRNLPPLISPENETSANQEPVNMDLPPGLTNLRNTCYLNSLLQYFYSVKAVRNLVFDLERPPLEPTEQHMQALLAGTDPSQLETGRAFVGHEFARELHDLFRALQTSTEATVTPRQRLANAALLKPEKKRPQSEQAAAVPDATPGDAPPLPPRAGEGSQTKVSVELVPEPSETASNVSSQTLVNQPDEDPSYVVVDRDSNTAENGSHPAPPSEDVEMTGVEAENQASSSKPNEASTKNTKLTVEELAAELDAPKIGSDQMDVDEIMGNAIDHLRAAFKVAHIDRRGAAIPDPIEEAFFSTFIDHRRKVGGSTWNRSTRTDRWVTAYPAKSGTRDIYDALGNSFNMEKLPGGLLSYATIDRPAPNFHIFIQRTGGVVKNSNPIAIREQLFLDRFMESCHHDPDMCKAKKRSWDINTRINELSDEPEKESNEQPSSKDTGFVFLKANKLPIKKPEVPVLPDDIEEFIHEHPGGPKPGQDETWSILNPAIMELFDKYNIEANPATNTAEPASQSPPEESEPIPEKPRSEITAFWEKFSEQEEQEMEDLLKERAKLFENVKEEVEYRLHAVVCHAGATAAAGHYWVWIHDFEQDVWRKYNDTKVTVHSAEFVFKELTTKGEPYYLAYVRAKDIPELVNIPRRRQPTPPTPPPDPMYPSVLELPQITPSADSSKKLFLPSGTVELPPSRLFMPSYGGLSDIVMPDADGGPTIKQYEGEQNP